MVGLHSEGSRWVLGSDGLKRARVKARSQVSGEAPWGGHRVTGTRTALVGVGEVKGFRGLWGRQDGQDTEGEGQEILPGFWPE